MGSQSLTRDYRYDSRSNTARTTDRKGVLRTVKYDLLSRPVRSTTHETSYMFEMNVEPTCGGESKFLHGSRYHDLGLRDLDFTFGFLSGSLGAAFSLPFHDNVSYFAHICWRSGSWSGWIIGQGRTSW